MKKFIFGIGLSLLILLTSCSLFNKDQKNPTVDPAPTVELKEIKAVDKEGTEITKLSVFQALKETEYTHPDVLVWAYYTDDTHKDVTKDAVFSTVDLTVAGTITVTVTYEEKTDTYTLEIKENKVTQLEINPLNCKNIYQVGSVFDSSGLVVRGTYTDETVALLLDYTLEFRNSSQEIDKPLKSAGTYTVSVKYGTLHQEFEILVYERNYHSTYDFQIDSLKERVTLSETGSHTFTDMNVIQTSGIVLNFNKNVLITKNETGEELSHKYNTATYTAYVGVSGITLTLSQRTDIFLVVGKLEGATLSFTSGSQSYPCFGHLNNYTSTLYCSLPAGTYTLEASGNKPILYDISFNSVSSLGVDTPRTYVLNVNSDAVKKNYAVGEALDTTGLLISLDTIPATTSATINPNICQYELKLNNGARPAFDQVGTYQVVVKYSLNSSLLQSSYTVTVGSSAVQYTNISVDTTHVTTNFQNTDSFQYHNLIVKANKSIGFDILSVLDYKVVLKDPSGHEGTEFTTPGIYTVEIRYIGQNLCSNKTTTYTVTYTKNDLITCKFGYSGPNTSSYPNYTVSFDPKNPEDVKNCIQIPNDYAFLGFSDSIYEAQNGDFFKVYIDKASSGKRFVVLLDEGYRYPAATNYYEAAVGNLVTVPSNATTPVLSAGVSFIGWDIPDGATVTDHVYYLPIISSSYPDSARIFMNPTSANSIDIELQNILETVIKYEVQVTKNGLNLQNMNSNTLSLTGLNGMDQIQVSGVYYGKLNGRYYKVEVEETSVSCASILALQAIDVSTDTILNVASNSFDIQIASFIDNSPEGYQLAGFEILDDTGTVLQDIPYDLTMDSLYVTGLLSNKEYRVGAYYDLIPSIQPVNVGFRAMSVTPGYRIHFVGYIIVTVGEINHRIRIIYQNECLYRFYLREGDSISNFMLETIMLPIHLEEYKIVGTTSNLTKVTSDIDAEAVLLKKESKNPYSVVFYDFNGTIISTQVVEEGMDATPPVLTQEEKEFFVENGSYRYKYVFTGWPTTYTNINANTQVYPDYERYDYTPPKIYAELAVGWDFLILRQYTTNGSSVIKCDIYATEASGKRVELTLNDSQKYTGVAPATFYTLHIDYTYLLPDDIEEQKITKEFEFTTLGTNETYAHDLVITDTDYCSISVSSENEDIQAIVENVTTREDLQIYDLHTKYKNQMSISYLDVNASYKVYYVLYIDNIYYIYNDPLTAQTEDLEPPVFPNKIYVQQTGFKEIDAVRVYVDQVFVPEGLYVPYFEFDAHIAENPTFYQTMALELRIVRFDEELGLYEVGFLPRTYPTYDPDTGTRDEYILYYQFSARLLYTYNGGHTRFYDVTQATPNYEQLAGNMYAVYGFSMDSKYL